MKINWAPNKASTVKKKQKVGSKQLIMTVNHVYSRAYHSCIVKTGRKDVARQKARAAVQKWKESIP